MNTINYESLSGFERHILRLLHFVDHGVITYVKGKIASVRQGKNELNVDTLPKAFREERFQPNKKQQDLIRALRAAGGHAVSFTVSILNKKPTQWDIA